MSEKPEQGLREISSSELKKSIENRETFIVEFSAGWCHPCKLLNPILEELSKEYGSISFYKVDVDSNNDVLDDYTVGAVPTMIFYGNGEKLSRMTGYHKKESIVEEISKTLSKFL